MMPQFMRLGSSSDEWKEPDRSILDIRRGPVPPVPLALVPQRWRDWIADTQKATGAPIWRSGFWDAAQAQGDPRHRRSCLAQVGNSKEET